MNQVFIGKLGDEANLRDRILESLDWIGWENIVKSGAKVFVKPNLTWSFHQPGVTTTPEVIEAIVSVLQARTPNIIVGESDGGYHSFKAEQAFKTHGLYDVADKYGIKVVNLSKTESEYVEMEVNSRKVGIELPSLLLHEIDVFITVPVPKIHAMTGVSLGFKNQWGCIPKTMRLMNHPEFNEKIIAINKLLNPKIVIFDGTYFLDKNGPQSGEPVYMDLIIASNDIGAGSFVCCKIMNIDTDKIKHFAVAQEEGMFPSSLDEVVLNDSVENFNGRRFRLEKNLLNRIASIAFNSQLGTKLVYDSTLADPIHQVLYTIRSNRVIRRLLYGKIGIPVTNELSKADFS